MNWPVNHYLKDAKKNAKTKIDWSDMAVEEFQTCKNVIANAVLLGTQSQMPDIFCT